MWSVNLKSNKHHLVLIATPIGNLTEMNPRALSALKELKVFLCEDTRNVQHLFDLLHLKKTDKTFLSYHKYNEKSRCTEILSYLTEQDVGVISDAGYPCFSDPGNVIVQLCVKNNIFVETINGSNAFINALVSSGWAQYPSTFYGFLDWSKKAEIARTNFTNTILVFYEAVHRINKTLKLMYRFLGDLEVVVMRELTKLNETHYFGKLSELQIPTTELKGEFVILVNNLQNKQKVNLMNLKTLAEQFLIFDQHYLASNLKNRIKNYLTLTNQEAVSAKDLYDLLIKK